MSSWGGLVGSDERLAAFARVATDADRVTLRAGQRAVVVGVALETCAHSRGRPNRFSTTTGQANNRMQA